MTNPGEEAGVLKRTTLIVAAKMKVTTPTLSYFCKWT